MASPLTPSGRLARARDDLRRLSFQPIRYEGLGPHRMGEPTYEALEWWTDHRGRIVVLQINADAGYELFRQVSDSVSIEDTFRELERWTHPEQQQEQCKTCGGGRSPCPSCMGEDRAPCGHSWGRCSAGTCRGEE